MNVNVEIERLLESAAQVYQEESGGMGLCQLQKDGRITGGLKYCEGQMAALYGAKKILMNPAPASEAIRLFIGALRDEWRRELANHQQKARPSMQWTAYWQGGVDALEAILETV
jgi:hypothetical protein